MAARDVVGWITVYRCGCSLLSRDHKHPGYCPYHAPALTTWTGKSTLAARTEWIAQTSPVYSEPIVWGLLVEKLAPVVEGEPVGVAP